MTGYIRLEDGTIFKMRFKTAEDTIEFANSIDECLKNNILFLEINNVFVCIEYIEYIEWEDGL